MTIELIKVRKIEDNSTEELSYLYEIELTDGEKLVITEGEYAELKEKITRGRHEHANDVSTLREATPSVELGLTGYTVGGQVLINCWGGGKGVVNMNPLHFNEYADIKAIVGNLKTTDLNDGGYGCEKILGGLLTVVANYSTYAEQLGTVEVGELSANDISFMAEIAEC